MHRAHQGKGFQLISQAAAQAHFDGAITLQQRLAEGHERFLLGLGQQRQPWVGVLLVLAQPQQRGTAIGMEKQRRLALQLLLQGIPGAQLPQQLQQRGPGGVIARFCQLAQQLLAGEVGIAAKQIPGFAPAHQAAVNSGQRCSSWRSKGWRSRQRCW